MTAEPLAPATPGTEGRPVTTLHRSASNRVLAGVCGGIAEHFRSDPTAVRLLAVVLGVITGIIPLLALYLVAAVIIPEGPGDVAAVRPSTGRPGSGALIVGAILVLVGVAGIADTWLHIDWDVTWPLVLVGLGGLLLVLAGRRSG